MNTWLWLIVAILFTPLALWWGTWLLLTLAALLPTRRQPHTQPTLIDILIPAHNESAQLPALLDSLTAQPREFVGNILVIADFCTDNTADIARRAGVNVLERNTGPRGKPAALEAGLAHLRASNTQNPLCILDADCTVNTDFLPSLAAALERAPVAQAAYGLSAGQSSLHAPASVAFSLKNIIRPRGAAALNIPVQLFGTGMVFSPTVAATLQFRDHLTEDLALSYDLLTRGHSIAFAPNAHVTSPLPENRKGMDTQKLRWEQGQFATWRHLPARILAALLRFRFRNLLAVLDWSAPPLALAVLYFLAATSVTVALALIFRQLPLLTIPIAIFAALLAYILLGTLQCGGIRAVGALFTRIPAFIFWKLSLYTRILRGRGATSWQRTDRDAPSLVK